MALLQPIDGMVAADHPLSTRRAFNGLRRLGQAVVNYTPEALWEQDTRRLPAPLRGWRGKLRDFSQRELAPAALELDLCGHPAAGDWWPGIEKLVRKAAAAGLMTDMLPRPLGAAPWSRTRYLVWSQALKTEEMARACGGQMLALCAHQLGLAPLLLSGDTEAIRRFALPVFRDLQHGEPHLCAYAITEPAAGSDVEEGHGASLYRPGVVARRDHGGWRLNGRKVFISGGDVARTLTVFASLEGEGMDSWTCFVVHRDMPGFRVARTELKMGMRASGAAELEFDDVFVPGSHVVLGERAVVGVSMYEYRVTSVGPYNEVGVAVPVFREGQPRPALGTLDLLRSAGERQLGFYILDLPVTTDVANAAGREFWGFPKFVTDIEFRWWRGEFRCQVMEPGSDRVIMRFTGQPRAMIPLPATDMVLYSHRDGDMLRSLINIRHGMSWNFPAGMRLETGTGEHPMGERLRRLELCGRRPFAVLSTRQFESRLNAGVPVEEVARV